MADMVLDIEELVRPRGQPITILGHELRICEPLEINPLEMAYVNGLWEKVVEIHQAASGRRPTAEELAELERVEGEALQVIIPGLTDELLMRLKGRDAEKLALVVSFFVRPVMEAMSNQETPANPTGGPPTGEPFAAGSAASIPTLSPTTGAAGARSSRKRSHAESNGLPTPAGGY